MARGERSARRPEDSDEAERAAAGLGNAPWSLCPSSPSMAATNMDVLDMSAMTSSSDFATALRPAQRDSVFSDLPDEIHGLERSSGCLHTSNLQELVASADELVRLLRGERLAVPARRHGCERHERSEGARRRGNVSRVSGSRPKVAKFLKIPPKWNRPFAPCETANRQLHTASSPGRFIRRREANLIALLHRQSSGDERGTGVSCGNDGPGLLPRKGRAPQLDK